MIEEEEIAGASVIFQFYLEGSGEMRELTEEVMELLLEMYERVIYAALRDIHMYRSNQNFDDYYQLGCLRMLEDV